MNKGRQSELSSFTYLKRLENVHVKHELGPFLVHKNTQILYVHSKNYMDTSEIILHLVNLKSNISIVLIAVSFLYYSTLPGIAVYISALQYLILQPKPI